MKVLFCLCPAERGKVYKMRNNNLDLRQLKWLIAVLYAVTGLVIWHERDTLYQHIPNPFLESDWAIWFLDAVLLILMAALFVFLVQLLRCPPFDQYRFQKFFRQIGLHNHLGEYPSLLSKRPDFQRAHGVIYKIGNIGIPVETLDSKICPNDRSLRIKVNRIEYGRKAKTILIYAVPIRYVKPNIISLGNESCAYELSRLPNLLCVGATGSGKSYALSVILAIYAHYIPNVSITISDYKYSLLPSLAHTSNFYGYNEALKGIELFYTEFQKRLESHDPERNAHVKILLIDEYSALLGSLDKKHQELLKTMVGNLLLMCRSLGMKIIIGMQTAHSENFKAGARDQFHAVLALGNLSKEQKQMLFYDYKDAMNEHNHVGEGYLLIDGKGIERVKIAEIKDMDALCDIIQPAMNR